MKFNIILHAMDVEIINTVYTYQSLLNDSIDYDLINIMGGKQ